MDSSGPPRIGTAREPRGGGAAGEGFSLVELLAAVSIVGMALILLLHHTVIGVRETSSNESVHFAYQKAMSLFVEIQSGVEKGDLGDERTLDLIDDGAGHEPCLTTLTDAEGEPFPPDYPTSGNTRLGDGWRWSRRITVEKPPGQDRLRFVRVRVFERALEGPWMLRSTVGGLVIVPPRGFASTKTYDVFVLALADAPSLWLTNTTARSLLESAARELETIDKGIRLRLHWIDRLGFGRDPLYTPFVNTSVPATSALPGVYWYPGLLQQESTSAQQTDAAAADVPKGNVLYAAELFRAMVRTEAGLHNGYDAEREPLPFTVADQWNHCMRLPDARALFEQRVAAGLEDPRTPPLRLLLEDMWARPEEYRNAILVNLHGAGVPLPPLRNVSDAAKSPSRRPGVRVVTHPGRLWTPRDPDGDGDHTDSEAAELRVYAYKTEPDAGAAVLPDPITVQIFGLDLTAAVNDPDEPSVEIRRLPGGVDPATGIASGPGNEYVSFDAPGGLPPRRAEASSAFEMSYEIGFAESPLPHTWIRLWNTPLVAPPVSERGLHPQERLYGMEYVPSPVVAGGGFPVDLATPGGAGVPKNTARWRIRVPPRVFDPACSGGFGQDADHVLTVATRIGSDTGTGVAWPVAHEPANLSRTYTWWTRSPAAVPITERYQILGDPRHLPYSDLAADGASFPHGYNWFFDDLVTDLADAAVKWPCFDAERLRERFGAGVPLDAPRLLQTLRRCLQSCGALWVDPTGAPADVLLLGGETAAGPGAAPGPSSPVRLNGEVFGATGVLEVDSIAVGGDESPELLTGRHAVMGPDGFWAKPWLGELCPDWAWSAWLAAGNLPAGPGGFRRQSRHRAALPDLPAGTDLRSPTGGRMGDAGATALLQCGSSEATFGMTEEDEPALSTAATRAIAKAFGDPVPSEVRAPFRLALDLPTLVESPHLQYPLELPPQSCSFVEPWFDGPSELPASALLRLEAPPGTETYLALSALTPRTSLEHRDCAMLGLMLGVRAFHRAGVGGSGGRIVQTPVVAVTEPPPQTLLEDPEAIRVQWDVAFERFDGRPYTEHHGAGFEEEENDLEYVLLASADEGRSWFDALTGETADPGRRPEGAGRRLRDASRGPELFVLPTPETLFPGGEYLLRVEVWHRERALHPSHHQVRVFVSRP